MSPQNSATRTLFARGSHADDIEAGVHVVHLACDSGCQWGWFAVSFEGWRGRVPPVCEQLLRLMKAGPGAGPAFFNLFGGFMGSDQIARLAGLVAFGVLGFYVELTRPVAEMLV